MSQVNNPCMPEFDDSTLTFKPNIQQIIVPQMGRLFVNADSVLKGPLPYLFPSTRFLNIGNSAFCVVIIPQRSGRFVSRVTTNRFNATGQGRTEEESLQDVREALELLIEEERNPSGGTPWPEDFR